jgi:DNA-directed RNA polymerase subunit RPC12/RpoP
MEGRKFLVVEANRDGSRVYDDPTEWFVYEAVVNGAVTLRTNDRHPGLTVADVEPLKKAIKAGETRFEVTQPAPGLSPPVLTRRYAILPAPPAKKSVSLGRALLESYDGRGRAAGAVAGAITLALTTVGNTALWGSGLPTWLRLTATAVAVLLSLFVSGLAFMFVADKVSTDDPVGRALRCPTCGSRMKMATKLEWFDRPVGDGRLVRETRTTDSLVCRRCGFERKLNG